MEWNIGKKKINNQIVMAPMAGISNPSYMKICEEMGVGFAVTELLSSEAIIRENKKTFEMLNGIDKLNIPIAIQIFGANANVMAEAAKIITNRYKCFAIDINMGCPVPKVALSAGAGSALLRDLNKVYDIVKAVVDSVNIPVTVKIRSGWDSNSINAVEVAQTIEKAGAKAITIHARTRSQGYSGNADWNIIKKVKESISIPVIGNGDIKNCYDAKRMIEETNCDAVMIGRGILGNPWLIKECVDHIEYGIDPTHVNIKDRINMIKKHFNYLIQDKGEKLAVLEMRTHIAHYLKGVAGAKELKQKLMKINSSDLIIKLLEDFLIEITINK